jgi:hypothetical protein
MPSRSSCMKHCASSVELESVQGLTLENFMVIYLHEIPFI